MSECLKSDLRYAANLRTRQDELDEREAVSELRDAVSHAITVGIPSECFITLTAADYRSLKLVLQRLRHGRERIDEVLSHMPK